MYTYDPMINIFGSKSRTLTQQNSQYFWLEITNTYTTKQSIFLARNHEHLHNKTVEFFSSTSFVHFV